MKLFAFADGFWSIFTFADGFWSIFTLLYGVKYYPTVINKYVHVITHFIFFRFLKVLNLEINFVINVRSSKAA